MVMDRLEGSEIGRLLRFKGSSRLEVKDDLTEKILEQKTIVLLGGLKFRFIESKKFTGPGGEWAEYKVLYSIPKGEQSLKYLLTILGSIVKMLRDEEGKELLFGDTLVNTSYLELEEFDSSRPGYYYILLGLRKDIGDEIQENEINEIFKNYEIDE